MSPYRDPVKQREAVKRAVRKHRVLHKGITELKAKVLHPPVTPIVTIAGQSVVDLDADGQPCPDYW
uniref:Uncharacterized protein n=1 Tax=viral metagenome TaxID=1070528 RepID=A0A6M3MEU3_9ZZZZ